ncbi:hypothetical protein ACXXCT_08870 [Bordetella bronchiseptica]
MFIGSAVMGWKGYATAATAGAMLVVAGIIAWSANGAAKFAAGREHEKLAAAANARQIEADYRRREQETAADYIRRLEAANDAIRISINERDRARADAVGLFDAIGAERSRAAKAAARAGISERYATRAWDLLQACTGEYLSLAADADRVIDELRPTDAWAKAVVRLR